MCKDGCACDRRIERLRAEYNAADAATNLAQHSVRTELDYYRARLALLEAERDRRREQLITIGPVDYDDDFIAHTRMMIEHFNGILQLENKRC